MCVYDALLLQVGHLATWAKEVAADAETAGWLNDWSLRGQVGSQCAYTRGREFKAGLIAMG